MYFTSVSDLLNNSHAQRSHDTVVTFPALDNLRNVSAAQRFCNSNALLFSFTFFFFFFAFFYYFAKKKNY